MNATKLESFTGPKKPPNAGKGRKPGSQNKVPKALKEMILGALERAGGEDYLLQQAHDPRWPLQFPPSVARSNSPS